MRPRQTLPPKPAPPRRWLVSDERQPDLPGALARLPRGSGVLFRHHATPPAERRALFAVARTIARARRLVLVLAGPPAIAAGWRADGAHGTRCGRPARPLLRTAAAHNRRELVAATRAGADLVFLSPVHPTRSHPGAPALGRVRFRALAQAARVPVIALGGMDAARARALAPAIHGWAGIDAWAPAYRRRA